MCLGSNLASRVVFCHLIFLVCFYNVHSQSDSVSGKTFEILIYVVKDLLNIQIHPVIFIVGLSVVECFEQ